MATEKLKMNCKSPK